MVIKPTIHYRANTNDGTLIHHLDPDEIVTFDMIDDIHAIAYTNFKLVLHCKYVNNKWVAHSDTQYALYNDLEAYYFFYEGVNYTIEDMPIDDECKVILLLKYGSMICNGTYDFGYVWYR